MGKPGNASTWSSLAGCGHGLLVGLSLLRKLVDGLLDGLLASHRVVCNRQNLFYWQLEYNHADHSWCCLWIHLVGRLENDVAQVLALRSLVAILAQVGHSQHLRCGGLGLRNGWHWRCLGYLCETHGHRRHLGRRGRCHLSLRDDCGRGLGSLKCGEVSCSSHNLLWCLLLISSVLTLSILV